MIYYGCPKCEAPMSSPESMIGEKDTCPICTNVCIVPVPIHTGESPHTNAGSGSSYTPEHSGRIITTERTSKRLKSHILFAWMALIVGIILIAVAMNLAAETPKSSLGMMFGGVVLVMFGVVVGVTTRIWIWWKHG